MKRKLVTLLWVLACLAPVAVIATGYWSPKTMSGANTGIKVVSGEAFLNQGTWASGGSVIPTYSGGTSANGSSTWTNGQYLQWSSSQKKVISAPVDLSTKQNADADLDSAAVTRYRASLFELPDSSASTPCGATQAGQLMYSVASGKMNVCNGTSWGPITYDRDGDGLSSALDDNDAVAFTAPTAAAADVLSAKTFRTGSGLTSTTGTISSSSAGNLATVDADFVNTNIKSGTVIFGVTGTFSQTPTFGRQVFTSSGTWTRPTGVDSVYVTLLGGGGAGGHIYNPWMLGGNGGGGGGFCSRIKVAVSGNVTVTIGAGGAGGGSGGGTTSFSASSATISVGGGGGGQTPGQYYSYGGSGGYASSAGNGSGGRGGNNEMGSGMQATAAERGGTWWAETGNGSGLYVKGSGGGGGSKGDHSPPNNNCTSGASWGAYSGGPCGTNYAGAGAGGGGGASPLGSGGKGGGYQYPGYAASGYGAGGGGGGDGGFGPYNGSAGYALVEWVAVN